MDEFGPTRDAGPYIWPKPVGRMHQMLWGRDDRAAAESLFDLAQIRLTIYSQTVRISLDKGEIAPILWKKVG